MMNYDTEITEIRENVNQINNTLKVISEEYKQLRTNYSSLNTMVANHENILAKIEEKIENGIVGGVEKALKNLDEIIAKNLKRELENAEYQRLKAEKERKTGWMDHGIKQVIGVAITGIIGFIIIVFQYMQTNNILAQVSNEKKIVEKEIVEKNAKETK